MKALSCGLMRITVALVSCGAVAQGAVPDFSRYQVIIDRNLFGEPVPEVVPPSALQPAVPPPPSFIEKLRLCGIVEESDGAWVALIDVGVNPNTSSLTKLGEENSDGVKVLDVDLRGSRVLLKKGDEEKWLGMEQAPMTPPGRPSGVVAPRSFLRTPPSPVTHTVNPAPVSSGTLTVAERLKQRREALERIRAAATAAPPPAVSAPTNTVAEMTPQERIKKLREYNLELIRAKGAKGPPLPIQLTPEEDDQLVNEGVLAPTLPQPEEP